LNRLNRLNVKGEAFGGTVMPSTSGIY